MFKINVSLIGKLGSRVMGSKITKLSFSEGKRFPSFENKVISDDAKIAWNGLSEGGGKLKKL